MIEFDIFWSHYPRKVGRLKAERHWNRMSERDQLLAIRTLELWKQTVQWTSSEGLFIPYGSTFLGQERFRDEPWYNAFEENGIEP
jgi:hypothetical protein